MEHDANAHAAIETAEAQSWRRSSDYARPRGTRRRTGAMFGRRLIATLGVSIAAFYIVLSLGAIAPEQARLWALSTEFSAALYEIVGGADAIALRAALAIGLFAMLAFPLNSEIRLPGPRGLIGLLTIIAIVAVGGALAVGVATELVRGAALDPLARSARDVSLIYRIGYEIGYLELVDIGLGHVIGWAERTWPDFAAATAQLGEAVEAPLSAVIYAAAVSFFAFLPIWIGLGALWALGARILIRARGRWRIGALRLIATVLVACAIGAVFLAMEPGA